MVRDLAGNTSDPITTTTIVDNSDPILDSITWSPVGPGTYQYADGTRLWFNPNNAGTARLTIAAHDLGSGVANTTYPDLDGAGGQWTPDGGVRLAPSPFAFDYSWTATAASNLTPNDPVQRSTICTSGTTCGTTRNLLDFMDITVDAEGRILVGYADGCVGTCVSGGANTFAAEARIARQKSGQRLFAAFD